MVKKKIKIEKISKKDINSLYKIGLQEFKGEFWFTKKYLRETIIPPGHFFGAFIDGKMVGGILAKELDHPKLWIFFFVVNKAYQRQGIGRMLLEKVEEKCSQNYPFLFVDVGVHDKIANNFYRKNKFKKLAKLKNWFGIGQDAYVYSKRIK